MLRKELLEALKKTRPALSSHDIMPILTHYCFTPKTVTAFDDLTAIEVRFESDLHGGLPGDLLYRLVDSYTTKDVSITVNNQREATIRSGKFSSRMSMMDPDSFMFEKPRGSKFAQIDLTDDVINAIRECLLFVGDSPLYAAEMGVTMSAEKSILVFRSTSSGNMSRSEVADVDFDSFKPTLLPTFFCKQLTSLFDGSEKGSIGVTTKHVFAESKDGKVYLFTRLPYKASISSLTDAEDKWEGEIGHYGKIPTKLLASAERANIILEKELEKRVTVILDEKGITVTASSGSTEMEDFIRVPDNLCEEEVSLDLPARGLLQACREFRVGELACSKSTLLFERENFTFYLDSLGSTE